MTKASSSVRKVIKKTGKQKKQTAAKQSEPSRPVKQAPTRADIKSQLKIQKALYEIADAASAVKDLQAFYKKLHKILGKLMYAENFFIASYDEHARMINWEYVIDEKDQGKAIWEPTSLNDQNKTGTAYVIRTGKMIRARDFDALIAAGEFEVSGTRPNDAIGLPLKSGRKVLGALALQSYQKDITYSDQDAKVLQFVAQHIATVLTRVRALEAERQRTAELAIINSVQSGLAAQLDIQAIFDLVGNKIRDTFDAQTVVIGTHDRQTNLFHLPYIIEKGVRQHEDPFLLGDKGFTPLVMSSRQPLMINEDFEKRSAEVGSYIVGGGESSKSAIYVPLVIGDEARGVISIQNVDREHAFDESDFRLLTTLASSLSVAFENARLFDETQRLLKITEDRAAELAIINSVSEGLVRELGFQAIIELVGEKIRQDFKVEDMYIAMYDEASNIMSTPYFIEHGDRFPIEPVVLRPGYAGWTITNRTTLVINENIVQRKLEMGMDGGVLIGDEDEEDLTQSVVCAPIWSTGRVIGVITLYSNEPNAFPESSVSLLTTLSANLGVALAKCPSL